MAIAFHCPEETIEVGFTKESEILNFEIKNLISFENDRDFQKGYDVDGSTIQQV